MEIRTSLTSALINAATESIWVLGNVMMGTCFQEMDVIKPARGKMAILALLQPLAQVCVLKDVEMGLTWARMSVMTKTLSQEMDAIITAIWSLAGLVLLDHLPDSIFALKYVEMVGL